MTVGNGLATLALGLIATACVSPALAQTNGDHMSAARAKATSECNPASAKYPDYLWGDFEIDSYRACMAEHGQQE
jgi:hypothetical protein